MYASLKYVFFSCVFLLSNQVIAGSFFEVTPSKLIVNMAPNTTKILNFTVSNNTAVDLLVTNVNTFNGLVGSLIGVIELDNCINTWLTKDNADNCLVRVTLTTANVSTTIQGFFDISVCIDNGAACSSSEVRPIINIGPGLPVELMEFSVD